MLREYNSGKTCPPGWSPSPDHAEDALRTGRSRVCVWVCAYVCVCVCVCVVVVVVW